MTEKRICDLFTSDNKKATPLTIFTTDEYRKWLKEQNTTVKNWINRTGYKANAGELAFLPEKNSCKIIVSEGNGNDAYALCGLYSSLPEGTYYITNQLNKDKANWLMLNFALDAYSYNGLKGNKTRKKSRLVIPDKAEKDTVLAMAESFYLARDLINTPPNLMGPDEFTTITANVAKEFKAEFTVYDNKKLEKEYPAVHAVGKGSNRKPKVLTLKWGKKNTPLVALVGKGICFDTGGLNLKGEKSMRLMKKDMGGAAIALSLARVIMANKLPLSLFVVLPLAENSPSGSSYRPSDVITARNGMTIEIGNTDAEGRVILADAISRACEEKPSLLIDFATLTGAARVALGTDIPPFFTNCDKAANTILSATKITHEPMWRMPLYQGYCKYIDSKIADISNVSSIATGGAITAALFLQKFVDKKTKWVHIDTYAYNDTKRNGRPEGGEAQTLKTIYKLIKSFFTL